jgi:ADP-L-glycero-D-manno-heptose 6-epimerase
MIVVTGGAGLIGSAIVWALNKEGRNDIVIVDRLGETDKWKNLRGLSFQDVYHKDEFFDLMMEAILPFEVDTIFHMGACSSTTEKDADYLLYNNYKYSVELAKFALTKKARFIYASSAATYGDGSEGYKDDVSELEKLKPLNMYGYSKQLFDLWIKNNNLLNDVAGLKFFNVYGPNEYHKGDMRSVVHKAFGQIKETGKVKLFKSYKNEYGDGEQKRDFVYVKDAVKMILFFYRNPEVNGIFNVGSGKAHSWNELTKAIFDAMNKTVDIEYIEMPESLREKYQYFTEADLSKIKGAGFNEDLGSLTENVSDYVRNYLMKDEFLSQ